MVLPGFIEKLPKDLRYDRSMSGPRLLLVEILNDDPLHQHRVKPFPFVQGWVKERGGVCRWVTVNAGRESRPEHPFLVEPPEPTIRLITAAVGAFLPTHVFINERIGDSLVRALGAAAPEAVLTQPPHRLLTKTKTAELGAHLGFLDAPKDGSKEDRLIIAVGPPDYTQERLDPGEPTADHFLPIVVEPRCLYRRSPRRSSLFARVPLGGLEFKRGCTFCCSKSGVEPIPSPAAAVERALLQLRRYLETVPETERRDKLMLHMAPAFSKMQHFFKGVAALDLAPSRFFFTCRADELLRMADALRATMPALAERGHALHFWQVGLESFSPDENNRFNKGITPEEIEETIALVDELEAAWPGSFVFREHGGFGMIVFTPWTRLEDLRINVREIQRHGLREQYAMLTTSLQLRASTPLEALAERDGLIVRVKDPSIDPFDATCITHWGEDELPWRFRHPEVAALFGAMNRIFPRVGAAPVELSKEDKESTPDGSPPSAFDHATVLDALLDIAEDDPGAATDTGALLQELPARLALLKRPEALPQGPVPKWVERLTRLLGVDEGRRWCARAGARLVELRPRQISGESHCLAVLVEVAGEQVELRLSLVQPGEKAFRVVGRVAISHAKETPLDSRPKSLVVDSMASFLRKAAERSRPA